MTTARRRLDGAISTVRSVATQMRLFLASLHPVKLAVLGYLSYVILGWLVLSLPIFHQERLGGFLDHLFTSASAVSTTGLTTVSTNQQYNLAGEIVVLLLIQLGGLGYMTLGSFLLLATDRRLSSLRTEVTRTNFKLPKGYTPERVVIGIVLFTLIFEALGAAALWLAFSANGVEDSAWQAIFHSVSAFCTAGFSLFDNSLESFAGDFWINAIIGTLSYLGAIGFIVLLDVWRMATRKIESITFTSKIILWMTVWTTVIGTALIFVGEPAFRELPNEQRLLASWFQTMTAMTTVGFNTVPIGSIAPSTALIISALMIIGASPSGTGGGLKSTTCSAMLGLIVSTVRGETDVRFRGRDIPMDRVLAAAASVALYASVLFVGVLLLTWTERLPVDRLWFEAISALGTVGLSEGITSSLSTLGKLVVIGMMFLGRIGPVTFGVALFLAPPRTTPDTDNDLVVG